MIEKNRLTLETRDNEGIPWQRMENLNHMNREMCLNMLQMKSKFENPTDMKD